MSAVIAYPSLRGTVTPLVLAIRSLSPVHDGIDLDHPSEEQRTKERLCKHLGCPSFVGPCPSSAVAHLQSHHIAGSRTAGEAQ